jgi:hypothetical protein
MSLEAFLAVLSHGAVAIGVWLILRFDRRQASAGSPSPAGQALKAPPHPLQDALLGIARDVQTSDILGHLERERVGWDKIAPALISHISDIRAENWPPVVCSLLALLPLKTDASGRLANSLQEGS